MIKSCISCVHWDMDKCGITNIFTKLNDSCEKHKTDSKFKWAVVYEKPGSEGVIEVFDVYASKKDAEVKESYVKIRFKYNNVRVVSTKEIENDE